MANITVTEVDVAIPEFWAATALGALKANTVMTQLVRRDFDSTVSSVGNTVNVIQRGSLSVNAKTAGSAVSLQNPTNLNVPVVLDVHSEVSFLIEDIASAFAIQDALNYVEDAAIVIGEAIDLALLGLHTDIENSVGSNNATTGFLDPVTVILARGVMNLAKCPQRGRVIVIGSEAEGHLLASGHFTNADFGGQSSITAIQEAALGRRYGFDFFMDQQVIITADTPDTLNNMAFTKEQFALVTRLLPTPPSGTGAQAATISEDGIGMRSIRSWNPDHLGMQFTIDVLYGVKTMFRETTETPFAVAVLSNDLVVTELDPA